MLSIAVSELRANLTGFLQQVKAGEIIVITSRGTEVARLVPPHFATTAAREQLDQLRQTAVVGDIVAPVSEDWKADA